MMATAQQIAERHGERLLIAGPGTWDGPKGDPAVIRDSRLYTDYATFTEALLDELDDLGFAAGPRFVWTQHNYNDTIYRHGAPGAPRNRAAHARELLVGRWGGYGGSRAPEVWLTEGGADLRAKPVAGDRAHAGRLVRENWELMADAGGDGAGIGMVTNYLGYSAPHFDTGLRDPLEAGGRRVRWRPPGAVCGPEAERPRPSRSRGSRAGVGFVCARGHPGCDRLARSAHRGERRHRRGGLGRFRGRRRADPRGPGDGCAHDVVREPRARSGVRTSSTPTMWCGQATGICWWRTRTGSEAAAV